MFDSILSSVERFAAAYPGAFAMLLGLVVVPLLGSVASFADGWAAQRWPVGVALLRAILPDVKRFGAILATHALERRRLPVPPEVRALTVERLEKAAEVVADKQPPPMPRQP